MKMLTLTQGKVAFVDDEDYERLSQNGWHCHHMTGQVRRFLKKNGKRSSLYLSHAIMGRLPRGFVWDHIDRNPLNNCKANLRKATWHQNSCNRSKPKGKTSKYLGVWWDRRLNRWIAMIKFRGTSIRIGSYFDEKAAALSRDAVAKKMCGEFASLNFPM